MKYCIIIEKKLVYFIFRTLTHEEMSEKSITNFHFYTWIILRVWGDSQNLKSKDLKRFINNFIEANIYAGYFLDPIEHTLQKPDYFSS